VRAAADRSGEVALTGRCRAAQMQHEKMNRPNFSSTVPAQPLSTRTVSIFKKNIRI
jgi:hypothetical protein